MTTVMMNAMEVEATGDMRPMEHAYVASSAEKLATLWQRVEKANVPVLRSVGPPVVARLQSWTGPVISSLDDSLDRTLYTVQMELGERRLVRSGLEHATDAIGRVELPSGETPLGKGIEIVRRTNEWWTRPLMAKVQEHGPRLLENVDERVSTAYETRTLSPMVEGLLPSFSRKTDSSRRQSFDSDSSAAGETTGARFSQRIQALKQKFVELRDLTSQRVVQLGLVVYARELIEQAPAEMRLAAKQATEKLEMLESMYHPSLIRASDAVKPVKQMIIRRLETIAMRSRQIREAGMQCKENLLGNMGDAYECTRSVTESTLSYMGSTNVRVMPRDAYKLFQKAAGFSERDDEYNEVAAKFSDLFEAISKIFQFSATAGAVAG